MSWRDDKGIMFQSSIRKDHTGEVYHSWTVIGHSLKQHYVKVRCLCGTETDRAYYDLKRGSSRHCGCGIKPIIPLE